MSTAMEQEVQVATVEKSFTNMKDMTKIIGGMILNIKNSKQVDEFILEVPYMCWPKKGTTVETRELFDVIRQYAPGCALFKYAQGWAYHINFMQGSEVPTVIPKSLEALIESILLPVREMKRDLERLDHDPGHPVNCVQRVELPDITLAQKQLFIQVLQPILPGATFDLTEEGMEISVDVRTWRDPGRKSSNLDVHIVAPGNNTTH